MFDFTALAAPFPPNIIHWRVGSTNGDKTKGLALAYIDARHVMQRLDDVCSPDGWQAIYDNAGNGKTCCRIGVCVNGNWVWKANGAGDTDVEADKGAFSDAFKRAAVLWGIGRYLYDLPATWVEIEQRGRSHVIKQEEYAKLQRQLGASAAAPKQPDTPPAEAKADEIKRDLEGAGTLKELAEVWSDNQVHICAMPAAILDDLETTKDNCKAKFTEKAA